MKEYKIIYYVGESIGSETIVTKGVLHEENDNLYIVTKNDRIALNMIYKSELFKLNGLGTMIKIINDTKTIFLTAYRIFFNIGTGFVIINYFETKKIKKHLDAKQIDKSFQDSNAFWNTDLASIWKISDKNQFLIAMNSYLCRKCNYGEDIGKLTEAEKIFYLNIQFESEVNNGGFSQFFFNSSGDFANETSNSLHIIGAEQTEKIYNKALLTLGGNLPKDQSDRQELLDSILTEAVDEILNECDTEFYKYPDNLEDLNFQFIIKNREQFN
ncbi:MAG: DUF4375 domain-containing protein [Oscillospiraceae bacterium]|nr:DUF4375 domain-containing protein [Oscillospiraceae bacterium]